MDYYYTPLQKRGQRFFEEYVPIDEVFDYVFTPDLSHVVADPTPVAPEQETDPTTILVYEGLRRLTATPIGRFVFVGAYALSYLPLLEQTRTAKTYGPSELMFIQGGLGGGFIV